MELDFTTRCRGCLSNDFDNLRSLYDKENANLYSDCVRFQVFDAPGLPMFLCGCCYGKCIAWKKFRNQCAETFTLLEQINGRQNNIANEQTRAVTPLLPVDPYTIRSGEYFSDESMLTDLGTNYTEIEEIPPVQKTTEVSIQDFMNTGNDSETSQAENIPLPPLIVEEVKMNLSDEFMLPDSDTNDTENVIQEVAPVQEKTEVSIQDFTNMENDSETAQAENISLTSQAEEQAKRYFSDESILTDLDTNDTEIVIQEEQPVQETSEVCIQAVTNTENDSETTIAGNIPLTPQAEEQAKRYFSDKSMLTDLDTNDTEIVIQEVPPVQETTEDSVQIDTNTENDTVTAQAENILTPQAEEQANGFTCDICSKIFGSKRQIRRHMLKHSDTRGYKCEVCGKTYKYIASLSVHRRSHRNARNYVCSQCGKSFNVYNSLRGHLLTHSTEKPFSCDCCSKSFKSKVELRNHKTRHEKLNRFLCTKCDKGFITSAELKRHLQAHSSAREYACKHCDKRYKTTSALAVHKRLHADIGPYKCDECLQTFYYSNQLENHRLIHTGERPWGCDICKKSFRLRCVLVRHMEQHRQSKTRQRKTD